MTGNYDQLLTYQYTSKEEMERLFSRDGIEYRSDDYNPTSESDFYNDVVEEKIEEASWEVKAILNKKFDDASAHQNKWIRRRATIIACYLLSIRRGNDAQYFNEYLDAKFDLEEAVNGKVQLGIPSGRFVRPGMINVSSDNRFAYAPMRADFFTSTDLQGIKYWNYYRPYLWV